jgi:predicted nucleotidyltransferase
LVRWRSCLGVGKINDRTPVARSDQEPHVRPDIAEKREALAEIRQRYGVERLEVFGSAARGADFDRDRSDADFLVTFAPAARNDLAAFADLKDAPEKLLGRSVDLVEREAIETSRNFIRRRAILNEAETVYG